MKRSTILGFGALLVATGCLGAPVRSATEAPPAVDSGPALLHGEFQDDYGISYTISPTVWRQGPVARYLVTRWNSSARYLIARNDAANPSDPGQWTRIDWVALSGMPPFEWAFCLSAYRAPSAAAAESTTVARPDQPKTGCNGYPFSRMARIRR